MRRLVFVCALLLCSCRTVRVVEQVPVEVHDTVSQKVFLHDSVYIDHFREVTKMNDTVFVTDSHMSVTYRTITDTTYKYIERPVTVTVEQIKEVKKPLAWWQKGLMWAGALGIFVAALAINIRLRKH